MSEDIKPGAIVEVLERGEWQGRYVVTDRTGRTADHLVLEGPSGLFELYNDAPYNVRPVADDEPETEPVVEAVAYVVTNEARGIPRAVFTDADAAIAWAQDAADADRVKRPNDATPHYVVTPWRGAVADDTADVHLYGRPRTIAELVEPFIVPEPVAEPELDNLDVEPEPTITPSVPRPFHLTRTIPTTSPRTFVAECTRCGWRSADLTRAAADRAGLFHEQSGHELGEAVAR